MLWAIAGFLAVAGTAGFFAYQELAIPKSQPQSQAATETTLPLKLSVAEKHNQLDVTWDRNAYAIVQAKRGVLYISDGLNKRELELTGAQLRTGRVLYSRLSADVSLRLEVFADGPGPVTESIRIVSTEALPEQPPVPEPRKALPVSANPAVQRPRPGTNSPPGLDPAPLPPPTIKAQKPAPVEAPPPEIELQRPKRR